MSVAIASRPTENLLLEGEAMEIVCRPAEGAVVEVGVDGSSIVIIDSAEG